jgi:sugar O-acyltransferase (sialic acid O-acetyltransferase NeuD family)
VSTPLVIVGAGGLGRETATVVADSNAAAGDWRLIGFVDDDEASHGKEFLGVSVIGDTDWLLNQGDIRYAIAIGSSRIRRSVGERLQDSDLVPATLIHPTVVVHPSHQIGNGVIIVRGAVMMLSVDLADHVIVDVNATLGHDTRLDTYTTLHPGVHISGNVTTGMATEIGAGAVVLPGVSIGENTVVGAGGVVTRDLPADCTAVGVPARPVPS